VALCLAGKLPSYREERCCFFLFSCAVALVASGKLPSYQEEHRFFFIIIILYGSSAFPEVSFLIGRSFGVERLGLVKRTIGCFKSRLVLDGSDQLNKKSDVSPKKYDVDGLSGRLGAPV
jgi:hypothetical protein